MDFKEVTEESPSFDEDDEYQDNNTNGGGDGGNFTGDDISRDFSGRSDNRSFGNN
jgi:hypothetical protein